MSKFTTIGNALAAEIENNVHYQGDSTPAMKEDDPRECSCVVVNSGWREFGREDQGLFFRALAKKAGFEYDSVNDVYNWNDNTPTPVVLETLRSL